MMDKKSKKSQSLNKLLKNLGNLSLSMKRNMHYLRNISEVSLMMQMQFWMMRMVVVYTGINRI